MSLEEASEYARLAQHSGVMNLSYIAGASKLGAIFEGAFPASPVEMMMNSAMSLSFHNLSKPRILNMFASSDYKISNILGTSDPKVALDILKEHKELEVVILTNKMEAVNLHINRAAVMQEAMDKGAIVMPYRAFIKVYEKLDQFEMPKILDFMD